MPKRSPHKRPFAAIVAQTVVAANAHRGKMDPPVKMPETLDPRPIPVVAPSSHQTGNGKGPQPPRRPTDQVSIKSLVHLRANEGVVIPKAREGAIAAQPHISTPFDYVASSVRASNLRPRRAF